MQTNVGKFRDALGLLRPIVPKKTALPIVTNVMVTDGKLIATGLEIAVAIAFPDAQGKFLIPIRPVMELLKHVPGDETLTIEAITGSIKLSWQGGGATYDVKNVEEFPALEARARTAEGDIDGDRLVTALAIALLYVATDETRPVLTGVALILGEPVSVVTADGFRLSVQNLPLAYPEMRTIVIPPHGVEVIEHLWRKSPKAAPLAASLISQITATRKMKLCLREEKLELVFGKITMFCNLISGNFPDYSSIIKSAQEPTKIVFMATDVYTAVRRLASIVPDGGVKLEWDDKVLTISAQAAEVGNSYATITLLSATGPGSTGIKRSYLESYLAGKDGLVTMGTETDKTPICFHYGTTPLVIIMPMFLEKKPEPPAAEETAETTDQATTVAPDTEEQEAEDNKENVDGDEEGDGAGSGDEETTEPGEGEADEEVEETVEA